MKKIVGFILISTMFVVLPQVLLAEEVCGGQIQVNPDCEQVSSKWQMSCCPSGYEVIGVAQSVAADQMQAGHAICRNQTKGNVFIATRTYKPNPVLLLCEEGETLAALQYKKNKKINAIQALSVGCENKGTLQVRQNKLIGLSKKDKVIETSKGSSRQVVGIAQKSVENSETANVSCLSLITK